MLASGKYIVQKELKKWLSDAKRVVLAGIGNPIRMDDFVGVDGREHAFGDVGMAVRAVKEGAMDFVLKPWQNEKLLATITAAFTIAILVAVGLLVFFKKRKRPSLFFCRRSYRREILKPILTIIACQTLENWRMLIGRQKEAIISQDISGSMGSCQR
jgi:hypothetical protein